MANTLRSGRSARKGLEVQVLSPALVSPCPLVLRSDLDNLCYSSIVNRFVAILLIALPASALALGEVTPPVVQTPTITAEVSTTPNTTSANVVVTDTTAPTISGVLSASLLETTAEIVWVTDELATSHLRYGTTASALTMSATLPVSALLVHGVVLVGLAPDTTYLYCIDVTDLFGNSTSSCGHSFRTATAETALGNEDTNVPNADHEHCNDYLDY
jgi:hypothetical protein